MHNTIISYLILSASLKKTTGIIASKANAQVTQRPTWLTWEEKVRAKIKVDWIINSIIERGNRQAWCSKSLHIHEKKSKKKAMHDAVLCHLPVPCLQPQVPFTFHLHCLFKLNKHLHYLLLYSPIDQIFKTKKELKSFFLIDELEKELKYRCNHDHSTPYPFPNIISLQSTQAPLLRGRKKVAMHSVLASFEDNPFLLKGLGNLRWDLDCFVDKGRGYNMIEYRRGRGWHAVYYRFSFWTFFFWKNSTTAKQ